ncbi:MAG: hypothetical protein M3R16_04245, partial [Pseudomonadota bacterium]|nr:hypothetical protein [Pseudomonadota bacterium]
MAKTSDALLRIRAKNLATKDIREVSTAIDKLAESQKKNATAAGLAARPLGQLVNEVRDLQTISSELVRRNSLITALQAQKAKLAELKKSLAGARTEVERLNAVKARGGFGADVKKQLDRAVASVRKLETQTNTASNKLNTAAIGAAKLGINFRNTGLQAITINKEIARTDGLINEATHAVERHNGALLQTKNLLAQQARDQKNIAATARTLPAQGAAVAAGRASAIGGNFGAEVAASRAATAEAARASAFRERLIGVLAKQKDGGEKLIATDG